MTDRLKGCTVAFDRDIREDDAEAILNAIRCLRHVLTVTPLISVSDDWVAEERARQQLGQKLVEMVYPATKRD